MRMYTCGVPAVDCNGSSVTTSFGIRCVRTAHNSSTEAFKCRTRYLIKVLGYTKEGPTGPLGAREFCPPDGGPILVLTKKSRFGGVLRRGKGGEQGASRVMPYKGLGGMISSY